MSPPGRGRIGRWARPGTRDGTSVKERPPPAPSDPPPPRKPFTIVVPFLDTPRGRAFASRSLPSAASLEPDEILVGIDAPAAPDLPGFLAGAASVSGTKPPLRAVQVERSPEWRLHPARVVHRCFEECRTDTALLYNIDTIIRRDALRGLGMVGAGGGASLVSFSLRLHTGGRPGASLRYRTYRLRSLVYGAANSGMFWLHLPDYFGRVDAAGYARVANGFGTYTFESLAGGPDTRVVADRTIGVDAMDVETGDLEWRQFGYGLWLYARRRAGGLRDARRPRQDIGRCRTRAWAGPRAARCGACPVGPHAGRPKGMRPRVPLSLPLPSPRRRRAGAAVSAPAPCTARPFRAPYAVSAPPAPGAPAHRTTTRTRDIDKPPPPCPSSAARPSALARACRYVPNWAGRACAHAPGAAAQVLNVTDMPQQQGCACAHAPDAAARASAPSVFATSIGARTEGPCRCPAAEAIAAPARAARSATAGRGC